MNPKILFISPGPTYEIRTQHYLELSRYFSGSIITSSSKKEILAIKTIGEFTWNCLKFNYYLQSLTNIYFFLYAISICLKKRFRKERIDLVATYDPLKTGFIGMLCAVILKAKFAPEVNGVYTSPAEYMDDAECFSTKMKKFFYPKLEQLVLSRAQGIKLLFPTQLDPFKKTIQGKIIRWFPNNVNIEPFFNLENKDEKNEILFAGFPFKRKGVDILIAAFKSIATKHPDWQLKILGWYPNLTELNEAIGDHPQIKRHPPVFSSEMPKQLAQCSIFVLPSRSEAMGRILVEAMAAGKPRIGSNVDGIPMVINDGTDGILFKNEDAEDLAQKLEMLIIDPDLRKKLGAAARERAKMNFNSGVYFNTLKQFYNEILKS